MGDSIFYLTFSMNPASPSRPFPEAVRQLIERIGNPEYYLFGIGPGEGILPGNILTFSRTSPAQLARSASYIDQHHRCMLLTAIEGQGVTCLDAEPVRLAAGEAVLVFPFQFHSYSGLQGEPFCWNFITFEMAAAGLEALESLRFSPRRLGPVEWSLLYETLLCLQRRDNTTLLPLHLGLLLRRLSAIEANSVSKPLHRGKNEAVTLLAQVNRHALPRLHKPLSIAELGRAIGLSESHLRARFREMTGDSLGNHLRTLRIRKACNLLRTTSLSIAVVAEQCGFESVYSFSRSFRAARGVSPRGYRQGRGD